MEAWIANGPETFDIEYNRGQNFILHDNMIIFVLIFRISIFESAQLIFIMTHNL